MKDSLGEHETEHLQDGISNTCVRNCEITLQILSGNTAFLTKFGLGSVNFPRVPGTIFDLFYFFSFFFF